MQIIRIFLAVARNIMDTSFNIDIFVKQKYRR